MIRVLLVEDSRITRKSIQQIFASQPDYELVASIENAANAEIVCVKGCVDLILMDICTADNESGLKAAQNIKRHYPHIKIVMMTSMPEYSFLKRAKEVGCDGFWYKEYGNQELLDVCQHTLADDFIWPKDTPSVGVGLIQSSDLTKREFDILRELAKGEKYEEIADHLKITVNTVKYHVKNILQKTGYRNTMQLVADVVSKQLILPNY